MLVSIFLLPAEPAVTLVQGLAWRLSTGSWLCADIDELTGESLLPMLGKQPIAGTTTGRPNDNAVIYVPEVEYPQKAAPPHPWQLELAQSKGSSSN